MPQPGGAPFPGGTSQPASTHGFVQPQDGPWMTEKLSSAGMTATSSAPTGSGRPRALGSRLSFSSRSPTTVTSTPTNANPSNPNWKKGECEYDALQIPRCNGLADDYCVPEGGSCSNTGECCEDRPCVPDPDDNNRLKCGTKACNEDGETCTTNADCCIGNICYIAAGEVHGSCSPPSTGTGGTGGSGTGGSGTGGTSSTGSGGTSSTGSGGSGTGGTSSTGGSGGTGSTPCSAYAQTCAETSDCCDAGVGVECLSGRCLIQN